MAIAFDAGSSGFISGSASITVSHTCTGANRALVVSASCPNSFDYLAGATVTYNGVSMGAARINSGLTNLFSYIWVLAAPATGTNPIVITPTGSAYVDLIAASFTGVDQTTPVSVTNSSVNGSATSPYSDTIALSAGGFGVDMFAKRATAAGLAVSGSQTLVATTNDSVAIAGMSYLSAATAMAWTFSDGVPTAVHVLVGLKAAASGATAVTLTGPTSGAVSAASSNFTVGANSTITGTVIVTPSDSAGGGTFTPATVSISAGTPTGTFTYTPASVGAKTISATNNGALVNPANITYTASSSAARLFRSNPSAALAGLGSSGPFFQNPLQ